MIKLLELNLILLEKPYMVITHFESNERTHNTVHATGIKESIYIIHH